MCSVQFGFCMATGAQISTSLLQWMRTLPQPCAPWINFLEFDDDVCDICVDVYWWWIYESMGILANISQCSVQIVCSESDFHLQIYSIEFLRRSTFLTIWTLKFNYYFVHLQLAASFQWGDPHNRPPPGTLVVPSVTNSLSYSRLLSGERHTDFSGYKVKMCKRRRTNFPDRFLKWSINHFCLHAIHLTILHDQVSHVRFSQYLKSCNTVYLS